MMDPVLLALQVAAEERTPQHIDAIISYLRSHRKDYQAGAKPKKADVVDITSIIEDIKPKISPGRRF